MNFKELRKLCARYDELSIRVNIAKAANNNGTQSKDDHQKVASLEVKMQTIKTKISPFISFEL